MDDKLKAKYKAEILLVKAAGEAIGYGNLMDIASVLWGQDLERHGSSDDGAFYPMCLKEMKDGDLKEYAVRNRIQKYEFYKELGIWGDNKDDS